MKSKRHIILHTRWAREVCGDFIKSICFDLEIDMDGSGKIELTQLCAKFLVEDPDRHRHHEGDEGRLQDLRQGGARRNKNPNNFLIMFFPLKVVYISH